MAQTTSGARKRCGFEAFLSSSAEFLQVDAPDQAVRRLVREKRSRCACRRETPATPWIEQPCRVVAPPDDAGDT